MIKNKTLKLLLMLAIITILCAIGIKVNAGSIDPDNSGKYTFNYVQAAQSDNIFCVQRWVYLIRGRTVHYKNEDNVTYTFNGDGTGSSSSSQANKAWAYFINLKNRETYTRYTKFPDSNFQMALWKVINDGNKTISEAINNGVSSWENMSSSDNSLDKAYALLREAYAYSTKASDISNENTLEIDSSRAVIDGTIVGPFKVKNGGDWIFEGELKTGITSIYVNEVKYENTSGLGFKILDSNKNDIEYSMVKFNQTMKIGFYIQFNDEITANSIRVSVNRKYINPETVTASIEPLSCTDSGSYSGARLYCHDHDETQDHIIYNNRYYYCTGVTRTGRSSTLPADCPSADGEYYYVYRKTSDYPGGTFLQCDNEDCRFKMPFNIRLENTPCPDPFDLNCNGYLLKIVEPSGVNYEVIIYRRCGNIVYTEDSTTVYCGGEHSIPYSSMQKLVDLRASMEPGYDNAVATLNLEPTVQQLTLQKVDKDATNASLSGAKFSGSISNIKSYCADSAGANKITPANNKITFTNLAIAKYSIYNVVLQDKNQPIVVKLTETQVPTGYIGVSGEITITLNYNTGAVTVDNAHKNSVTAEYTNGILTVKVENEKKMIDELQIKKIDSETLKALTGAKFEVTVTNVESFVRSGTTYTDGDSKDKNTNINEITYEFEVGNQSGTEGFITLKKVILANKNNDVTVTLKETQAPKGYAKLADIVVTISYTGETATATLDGQSSSAVGASFTREGTTRKVEITAKNFKKMIEKIRFIKVDADTLEALKGAKFKVTISNILSFERDNKTWADNDENDLNEARNTITRELTVGTSDAQKGYLTLYNVILAYRSQPLKITLEEIKAPQGHALITEPIEITINYKPKSAEYMDYSVTGGDSSLVVFGELEASESGSNYYRGITVKIKDKKAPKIISLKLTKTDKETGEKLAGAKFSGTITNAINPTTFADITTFSGTTNSSGEFTVGAYMMKDVTKPIVIKITETQIPTPASTGFRYKKLDKPIEITLKYNNENGNLFLDSWKYDGDEQVAVSANNSNAPDIGLNISVPNSRLIDISGLVWRDGDTIINNKTNGSPDGKKDSTEKGVPNVIVYLKNSAGAVVKTTITDEKGEYKFTNVDYDANGYYVEFEYDGINNIETRAQGATGTDSKASEVGRAEFNNKFNTITNNKATSKDNNTTTELSYNTKTSNGIQKSTLITTGGRTVNGNSEVVQEKFAMKAISDNKKIVNTTTGVNLGLVLRGTDLAASNKVSTARVTINGEETTYNYNSVSNSIDINKKSSEQVAYNLQIRKSDYTYRIRDYVNSQNFTQKDYTDNITADGKKSGDELKVYVTYQVDMTNQSLVAATVKQLVYNYDSRYTFNKAETDKLNNLAITESADKTLTIDVNKQVNGGASQSIYLVFELSRENIADNAEYYNAVEITSYSTDQGLIDIDSNPGNLNYNKATHTGTFEDDSDEAGGVKITISENNPRTISGYVFEDANMNGTMASGEAKVNDVIVQLIELKTINNKQFEYIWQETVSGSNKLRKLSNDGQSIEESTYTKKDGYYEFSGFIPGNYIVRFIYGDGTTYDLNGNIIKYNGQDYKSTIDPKYTEKTYNEENYSNGSSVARDNEARRLETMAYASDVDANKGILLKLLDAQTVDGFNEVEKQTLIKVYNAYYDPDITTITNEAITKLLKEQTLANTWMCAETSTVNVGVDTNVNLDKVYFGLNERPKAEIELKKFITGFKLTASNGQVLVNARIDVNKYFENNGAINDYIEGIKDSIQAINEYWKYEVEPTTINTVVEGATLEFEYTVVVLNTSAENYLGKTLINAYNNGNYEDYLKTTSGEVKANIKSGTHSIGSYLGTYYYDGISTESRSNNFAKTQIEITDIRDYIRNDLKYVSGTNDIAKFEEPEGTTHYILNTDYSLGTTSLQTVLKNGMTSGKLTSGNRKTMYAVSLEAASALSSAGKLDFENYIAEVMRYTNAAGRRVAHSTPGNAEIIDHEHRTGYAHEIDEAATADIQISAATGNDEKTLYIWLITIISSIIVIAAGAYTTKKFIVKK